MKTILIKSILIISTILFSSTILTAQNKAWVFNYKIAKNSEELLKIMDNPKTNIVRSVTDFKRYVKSNPKLRKVFAKKKGLLESMTKSMKFNKRGLQTFSYKSLKEAYPEKYKDILIDITPGFGFDMDTLGVDYDGMACVSTATCKDSLNSVCIGDNC